MGKRRTLKRPEKGQLKGKEDLLPPSGKPVKRKRKNILSEEFVNSEDEPACGNYVKELGAPGDGEKKNMNVKKKKKKSGLLYDDGEGLLGRKCEKAEVLESKETHVTKKRHEVVESVEGEGRRRMSTMKGEDATHNVVDMTNRKRDNDAVKKKQIKSAAVAEDEVIDVDDFSSWGVASKGEKGEKAQKSTTRAVPSTNLTKQEKRRRRRQEKRRIAAEKKADAIAKERQEKRRIRKAKFMDGILKRTFYPELYVDDDEEEEEEEEELEKEVEDEGMGCSTEGEDSMGEAGVVDEEDGDDEEETNEELQDEDEEMDGASLFSPDQEPVEEALNVDIPEGDIIPVSLYIDVSDVESSSTDTPDPPKEDARPQVSHRVCSKKPMTKFTNAMTRWYADTRRKRGILYWEIGEVKGFSAAYPDPRLRDESLREVYCRVVDAILELEGGPEGFYDGDLTGYTDQVAADHRANSMTTRTQRQIAR
ncbi:hypothetical protein BC829DRAFT_443060 [Chytridium lagenaria]|nr:hypothetical protein BC829DRAFT_443060 [Chytridium lagenaria]